MSKISQYNPSSVNFSRTLFLFKSIKKATDSLTEFLNHLNKSNQTDIKGAIVGDNSLFTNSSFKTVIQQITRFPNVKKVKINQVSKFLGKTVDFVVMDLRTEFNPNKLIILVETVRGGGLILLLGDEEEKWIHSVNKDYFDHSKGSNLLKWFLFKIKHNQRSIIETEEKLDLMAYYNPMPNDICLSEEILGIPITPSQKAIIEDLSREWNKDHLMNKIDIIIADRGRGKSAAIGLTLAQVLLNLNRSKRKIIITANEVSHTQTLFKFLSYGLTKCGIGHQVQQKNNEIISINIHKGSKIEYRWPSELSRGIKAHLLIVDEAAAFPQEILSDLIKLKIKTVLISTIHGYEGAGRSFQHKILDQIARRLDLQYQLYTLDKPIRYSQKDSIESLINDTFLLQIDRSTIDTLESVSPKQQLDFRVLPDPSSLLNKEGVETLREIYGILIYAHYRNQPNDLLLLADSRRHFLVILSGNTSINDQHVLLACQLAREGSFSQDKINIVMKGEFIEGDLIPAIGIRHFSPEFAKLNGLRIVRIASHPNFINKGFGRVAVEKILGEFQSYDWIGVSFGVTLKLIKFWRKMGFKTIHIRPIRTPGTGEWNVVLIHPNSDPARALITQASRDFFLQFIHLLKQSLFELKPELSLEIMRTIVNIPNYEPRITKSGIYRLKKYIEGNLNFLLTVDVLQEIVISYFVIPMNIQLSPAQEKLLIARILQGRTWGQTLGKTGLSWKEANGLLKKAIMKIVDYMNQN